MTASRQLNGDGPQDAGRFCWPIVCYCGRIMRSPVPVVGVLVLAATVAIAEPRTARAAEAGPLEISLSGGTVGVDGYGPWKTAGGSLRLSWGGRNIKGGVRQTFSYASIPYGDNDGEPTIGHTSGYSPGYFRYAGTLIAITDGVLDLSISIVELELRAGFMHLSSSEWGERWLIPMPGGGAAIAVRIPGSALALRASLDVHTAWEVAYLGQASVAWQF
jgi:hypothetical protein